MDNSGRNNGGRRELSLCRECATEVISISGRPAAEIGNLRNLVRTHGDHGFLIVLSAEPQREHSFSDDNSRCYLELFGGGQCVYPNSYVSKVERAFVKGKAVLLCFTHMDDAPGAETLTEEEVNRLTELGKRMSCDVHALLITNENEVAIKYAHKEDNIFRLPNIEIK